MTPEQLIQTLEDLSVKAHNGIKAWTDFLTLIERVVMSLLGKNSYGI